MAISFYMCEIKTSLCQLMSICSFCFGSTYSSDFGHFLCWRRRLQKFENVLSIAYVIHCCVLKKKIPFVCAVCVVTPCSVVAIEFVR